MSLFKFLLPISMLLSSTITYGSLLDKEGKVRQEVLNLLKVTQLAHNGSLEDIVRATQKNWLRTGERWEKQSGLYENKREKIIPLLDRLHYLQEIAPSSKQYDYLIILGCTSETFRLRLSHAVKLWKSGITFNKIVFLSSARPVDPQIESADILYRINSPALCLRQDFKKSDTPLLTEDDMMRFIYKNGLLPNGFRTIPIQFVPTPLLNKGKKLRRPTTADTVVTWLNQSEIPPNTTCLAISNQPSVGYQNAVLKTLLAPHKITVETVGLHTDRTKPVILFLDSLARQLWQEQKRLQKDLSTS